MSLFYLTIRNTTTSRTPIWLDNLYYCDSNTSDLRQCTNAVGVHDCGHHEDVILTCSGGNYFYVYLVNCILERFTM